MITYFLKEKGVGTRYKGGDTMQGLICYYSNSGNTKLACDYLVKRIDNIGFDFCDIKGDTVPDFDRYSIIGFATSAYYAGPPFLVRDFINNLTYQDGKLSFIFNTFGLISGKTLAILNDWVSERGFVVLAGHSLQTPESYPPLRAKGYNSDSKPTAGQLEEFNGFIDFINRAVADFIAGKEIKARKISIGLLNRLLPVSTEKKSGMDMGGIFVDSELCTGCGICSDECPHSAIQMNTVPLFDKEKCQNCWNCFNKCPVQAIYTSKLKGTGHYPKTSNALKEKLLL